RHGLLQRGVRVRPVTVEDVDVVKAQSAQGVVQRRQQVLAGSTLLVWARSHDPPGLGRDDQLMTVGAEVLGEESAEVLLGAARGWAVVVGQVEVEYPEVEGTAQDAALPFQVPVVAEVLPQSQ